MEEIKFYKEWWKYRSRSGKTTGEYVWMVGKQGYHEEISLVSKSAENISTRRQKGPDPISGRMPPCSLIKKEEINYSTASDEDKKFIAEIVNTYEEERKKAEEKAREEEQREKEFNSMPEEFRQGIERIMKFIEGCDEDREIKDPQQIALFIAAAFGICSLKLSGYYGNFVEPAELDDSTIEIYRDNIWDDTGGNSVSTWIFVFVKDDIVLGRVSFPSLDNIISLYPCDFGKFGFINIVVEKAGKIYRR